ncbi:hypothetical protein HMPREF3193_01248 [Bifidobacterium breve]|nr:hypothetical protein HMPREF1587_01593 [Bifidobacterium breve JCP7499]KWZ85070.1 hypothetical protein HMPREF3193_01248 [Bifidobacterium breve]
MNPVSCVENLKCAVDYSSLYEHSKVRPCKFRHYIMFASKHEVPLSI